MSGFIPAHGGYHKLLSYQKAEIVYDATVEFCRRFMRRSDRTVDQMIQAARSGKQNIIEGSRASGTSKEMEIKLTGVARASLDELLTDYLDYLRTNGMKLWDKDSEQAVCARKLGNKENGTPSTYEKYRVFVETRPAETVANIIICAIHQANYLLDQQIKFLEQNFIAEGGLRERMTRARLEQRRKDQQNNHE